MKYILHTERFKLREFNIDDAEAMYLLNLNFENIRYTGDAPFTSIDDAKNFIEHYDHYQQYGFGRWAVVDLDSDEFIGWCGIKFSPELDEYDIGFRFFQSHWNKGIATETAAACIDHAFNQLQIPRIVGRAMLENKASIHVLEKIGMNYIKPIDFNGTPGVQYEVTSPQLKH